LAASKQHQAGASSSSGGVMNTFGIDGAAFTIVGFFLKCIFEMSDKKRRNNIQSRRSCEEVKFNVEEPGFQTSVTVTSREFIKFNKVRVTIFGNFNLGFFDQWNLEPLTAKSDPRILETQAKYIQTKKQELSKRITE